MRLAGLIVLASCAVLESYCASLGDENHGLAANKQANSSRQESRFRQFNSIEPFLQERARQQASRQGTSQESLSSLTNNLSAEPSARQLAYRYVQAPNSYGQQASYNYPPNKVYYQQQQQQSSQPNYNQPGASGPLAYFPQVPIQAASQTLQSAYSSSQKYGSSSGSTSEFTKVIYERVEDKKTRPSSPQYALQEVIELADPNIKIFSTKRADKNSVKTIVSFRLARKVRLPLNPRQVLQPEFYRQEDPISFSAGKTVSPKLIRTSSKPKTTAQPELQEAVAPENENEDENENENEKENESGEKKSANDVDKEPEDSNQNEEQEGSSDAVASNEPDQEPAKADAVTTESHESADGASSAEINAQQAARQTGDEDEGLANLNKDEQPKLDEFVASKDPEEEDEDKAQDDSGKNKVGNLLNFPKKEVGELIKKASTHLKTSDEAESEQSQESEDGGQQVGEQKVG